MPAVVFRQLSLQGFGRYKDKVTVEFAEGINVLAAPNESGKSTLVAGLTAVIFGLPASSDLTAFGTSRYRNWDGAPAFSGEVLFSFDLTLHQIMRDFDSQRITVRKQVDGRWTELVRGVHNPRANRPNERYLEFLDQVLGLRSAEVFMQTYFVGQPLPAATALTEELQQLLSGGGSHYSRVLDQLIAGIKRITRYGSQCYASLNNGRKDQQLEEIRVEKTRLADAIADQSHATDDLEQLRLEIASREEQRRSTVVTLRGREAAIRGFEQWLALRDRMRAARSRLTTLQSAAERARELEIELVSGIDTAAEEAVAKLTADISTLDVVLVDAVGFAALGAEPAETVHTCRDWLHQKVQLYRQKRELCQAAGALRESLLSEYAAFEEADLAVLQKLPTYLLERPRLVAEAELANRSLQHAQQDVDQISALRAELSQQLGDPESIYDAEITELQAYCAGQKGVRREHKSGIAWWAFVIGIAASAALYMTWGRAVGVTGVVTSLAPLLLSIIVAWLTRPANSVGEAPEVLGRYAKQSQIPREQLSSLLARLQHYRMSAKQNAASLSEAQARQRDAHQRLQDADSDFAELVRQHPQLDRAFAGWRQIRSRIRDLATQEEQLMALLAYRVGDATGFEGSPGRLSAVVALTRHAARQGEQLLAALDEEADDPWAELLAQAAEYVQLVRQRTDLVARLQALKDQQTSYVKQAKAALEVIYETNSCRSLEALQERLQDAQEELLLCRRQWKELLLKHPELPEISDMEDSQLIATRRREISEGVTALEVELEQLDQRVFALKSRQAQLEGRQSINLAQAMEQLAELDREEQRLLGEATALGIAASELSAAIAGFLGAYRNRLANRIAHHFQSFTGDGARGVAVDDSFALQIQNADGQLVSPTQLSQGAQDQLYLAVRLAIADLTAENTEPPLILDDPLLTSDQERLARMRLALERLGRQVILLSHQAELEAWGTTVKVL